MIRFSREKTSFWQIAALLVLLIMFGFAFWLPSESLWYQWDKVIHTISGAALALLFYPYAKRTSHLIWFVLIIGGLFEIAEFIALPFGLYGEVDRYIIDTVLDLVVDTLGAIIMIQLIRLRYV